MFRKRFMATNTGISWTDHTFNPWWGCTKVSPGCINCYALKDSERYGHDVWDPNNPRRELSDANWDLPLKWNLHAEMRQKRARVFSGSMCDWAEDHPQVNSIRPRLWDLIHRTPALDWQLLTKRADRIKDLLPTDWKNGYPNVWIGVSVENQEYANLRIPYLLAIPATTHFISYEPALGPINFVRLIGNQASPAIWIIYGGESGPKFRPDDDNWARATRDQCAAMNLTFYRKQSSGIHSGMGVELDGVTHHNYPGHRLSLPILAKPTYPRSKNGHGLEAYDFGD
jgi:protein gp37